MSAATKVASSGQGVVAGGETVIKGRRGTLYHLSSRAEQQTGGKDGGKPMTLEDLTARRRFATSRYFLSPAGLLKLLVIILFLVNGTLFLTSDSCPETPAWYTWLYPLSSLVAVLSTAFLYLMFMLGLAEDNPSTWVKTDLGLTLAVAVGVIVISILTITGCATSRMSNTILGPLGLTGAALMVVSTAATYIMWRYRGDEQPLSTPSADQQKPRRSFFI